MIRPATFSDIPAIVRLLQQSYMKTHYARTGIAEIDEPEAKRLLLASIQRHGQKHGGACWVCVVDSGASIDGLILGTLTRVYSIGNRLMATDLFWLVNEHADPRDAIGLMKGMVGWAEANPAVVEVHCGTTAIIADDPAVTSRLLAQIGFKQYGLISRLELRK
ncbi:hypothetical protein ACFFTN_01495 [Aminobacter aganoensis]|uniref:N-acetyltransferase domain-containing protein n=1 Tax=Aminobacter aganoensis TaxID=83264 RepID=A0A7X0F5K3_9HYPH|nr:hypothetical protein [Aminobacter aganoensis]MBB6353465.1 hypothetical protein [Aminobacter aganoensis]